MNRRNSKPTPVKAAPVSKLAGSVISLLRLGHEQRRHYRVPQGPGTTLQVTVPFTDGTVRTGLCLDVAFGGAGVHFATDQDPDLERGDELLLVFQVVGQPGTMRVVGKVLFRMHLGAGGVRYAFTFPRLEEMNERVNGWWGKWFNRRKYKRFAPGGALTMPAQLRWAKGQIDGRVADISLGGMSMEYDRALGQKYGTIQPLHVSISMPSEDASLRFAVVVRSSFAGTRNIRVGLEFLRDKSYDQNAPYLQRWIERHLTRIPGAPPRT
ncbi:MAG: PilZ domain-containing protein [Planctomycetes bacterium]|nr:PilZ domain-containing protein [Planctomycetota bacterium]